MLVKYQI